MSSKLAHLELSLVNHPSHVLEIGEVSAVPSVGDFVDREESGFAGYVKDRRFKISKRGEVTVRLWLQRDPP